MQIEPTLQQGLKYLVAFNVPRYIEFFHSIGGVDQEEWDWLTYGCGNEFEGSELEDPTHPCGVFMQADELLLYPTDKKVFDKSLFVLVRALAIMSFIPGGVLFDGLRFDSTVEGYCAHEP